MEESLRIAVARRLVVLGALLVTAAPVLSQTPGDAFPARPVHIVAPFGSGSGTDLATRMLGQHLEVALKQGVVIDNRPGANRSIAAVAVARNCQRSWLIPACCRNSRCPCIR